MVKYFVDMDGVLAVWNDKASEEETHEKGYFLNRDVELSAVALVRSLMDKGEDISILSSVYEDDHSAEEKKAWLQNAGLGDIPYIFVPYGKDKHEYICAGGSTAVLIDDYGKNLEAWEKQGHLPIKFMNGFNNRPKLEVEDGVISVKTDSWSGYSIDKRMSPQQMFTLVTSVAKAVDAA